MNKIEIYTDGSCKGDGTGAYGFVVASGVDGGDEYVGYEYNTTNQRMELRGVLSACVAYGDQLNKEIMIYTDSAYVCNCKKDNWWKNWQRNGWRNAKNEPVKNQDLWELLIPYFQQSNINLIKVKGHQGNYWNEKIDVLVQNTALFFQSNKK